MRIIKTMIALLAICPLSSMAQKLLQLASPDKSIVANIKTDGELCYAIGCDGRIVVDFSPLSMTTTAGVIGGKGMKLSSTMRRTVDEAVAAPFYRASQMRNNYNALTLKLKNGWSIEFRAYNDGVAYRFATKTRKPFNVVNETVSYKFQSDNTAYVPYTNAGKDGDYKAQFQNSFENIYAVDKLSKLKNNHLMFLPLVVESNGIKVCISESDLCDYPGLYLSTANGNNSLNGMFAPYPKHMKQGGYNNLQMQVKERENYIAKVAAPRTFPWRMAIIAKDDKTLAESNMTYLLAEPSKVSDTSWIKPGKVAWDWWNNWNIDGVDFTAGINTQTYKYYIDFAAKKNIEYVILDEGWAVNKKADLMQVVKDIDLKEIIDYGKANNVGIILWAGYWAFDRDLENICRHYSEMGVKGFKVDFMNRDDQIMTEFQHRAAEMCAKYKLVLDYHGSYKPAGINRTYPNVLNVEGVHGLEQMKWNPASIDQVEYDVMIPFIRQAAGPIDYTQGAMRNAAKGSYSPNFSEPMSQGTRCRQLALYMVFDSPLNMLCDNPSNYMREPECTEFIGEVPTTWDETRILQGKMGEYIVSARRKGNTWYVGGITDWTARNITIDLSFSGAAPSQVTLFRDGANAHRAGRDYKKENVKPSNDGKINIHLAPGGGFAMKFNKAQY